MYGSEKVNIKRLSDGRGVTPGERDLPLPRLVRGGGIGRDGEGRGFNVD